MQPEEITTFNYNCVYDYLFIETQLPIFIINKYDYRHILGTILCLGLINKINDWNHILDIMNGNLLWALVGNYCLYPPRYYRDLIPVIRGRYDLDNTILNYPLGTDPSEFDKSLLKKIIKLFNNKSLTDEEIIDTIEKSKIRNTCNIDGEIPFADIEKRLFSYNRTHEYVNRYGPLPFSKVFEKFPCSFSDTMF